MTLSTCDAPVASLRNNASESFAPQIFPGEGMRVGAVGRDPDLAGPTTGVPPTVQVQQRHQLRIVAGLAGREDHRDRAGPLVGQGMNLGRQSAPGSAQRVVSSCNRCCPLGPDRSSRRLPRWRSCGPRLRVDGPAQRRNNRQYLDDGVSDGAATFGSGVSDTTRSADPATASRFGIASRSPQASRGDRSTAGRADLRRAASAARPPPRPHLKSHLRAVGRSSQPWD